MARTPLLLLAALGSLVSGGEAQSLASRVAQAPDGKVLLSFAARPEVCGDGQGMIRDGHHAFWITSHGFSTSDDDEGNCPCDDGPVRVALTVREHRVVDLRTYVGGGWSTSYAGAYNLGPVSASGAADFLLSLAEKQANDAGDRAIFPATLADSVTTWPALLRIARNGSVRSETRRQAVFWLSQAAGDAATKGLDELVNDEHGDLDVREHAVFALSQRPGEEGVPALLRIARSNRNGELRRKALFWLGQSDDPRALALFEELLTAH